RTLQVGPVPRNAGGGFRFAQERSAESSARSGALGAPCLFARRGEREAPPLAPVGRATAREELASLGDAHDAGVRGRALGVLGIPVDALDPVGAIGEQGAHGVDIDVTASEPRARASEPPEARRRHRLPLALPEGERLAVIRLHDRVPFEAALEDTVRVALEL